MRFPNATRAAITLLATIGLLAGAGCDRDSAPSQVGRPAPTFALNDGLRSVDLASLHGQVVVLSFWATWCAPCIEEMPSLVALQQQVPQVKIIGIASTEDFTTYQSYMSEHHVALFSVFDSAQTSNKLYGSFRFPETYVIDKQGLIRRKFIGPQDWTSPSIVRYLQGLAA